MNKYNQYDLIEACENYKINIINKILKSGIYPNIECFHIICKNIEKTKTVFRTFLKKGVIPDVKCYEILFSMINDNNFQTTYMCCKRMKTFIGCNLNCIKILLSKKINFQNKFHLIKEMMGDLSFDLECLKIIIKENKCVHEFYNYIKDVDEECYYLLIKSTTLYKIDVLEKMIENGLIITNDMFLSACDNKYNGEIIKFIINNQVMNINYECLKKACSNKGNKVGILEIMKTIKPRQDLFPLISKNGDSILIKYLLKQGLKPTNECISIMCSRGGIINESLILKSINISGIEPQYEHLEKVTEWCDNRNGLITKITETVKPKYECLNSVIDDVQKLLLCKMDLKENLHKILKKSYYDEEIRRGIYNFELILQLKFKPKMRLVKIICKTMRNIEYINSLIKHKIKFDIVCLRYLCKHKNNEMNIYHLIKMGIKPDYKCLYNASLVENNDVVILQFIGINKTKNILDSLNSNFLISKVFKNKIDYNIKIMENICKTRGNIFSLLYMLKTIKPDITCIKLAKDSDYDVDIIYKMIDMANC